MMDFLTTQFIQPEFYTSVNGMTFDTLDAPEYMAAGSMIATKYSFSCQQTISRTTGDAIFPLIRETREVIDFVFADTKTGERYAERQLLDTQVSYEAAAVFAQRLANKLKTGIAFTAWLADREGATAYRYPRSKGRPANPNAATSTERVKKLRQKRTKLGLCPCCGQQLPLDL